MGQELKCLPHIRHGVPMFICSHPILNCNLNSLRKIIITHPMNQSLTKPRLFVLSSMSMKELTKKLKPTMTFPLAIPIVSSSPTCESSLRVNETKQKCIPLQVTLWFVEPLFDNVGLLLMSQALGIHDTKCALSLNPKFDVPNPNLENNVKRIWQ